MRKARGLSNGGGLFAGTALAVLMLVASAPGAIAAGSSGQAQAVVQGGARPVATTVGAQSGASDGSTDEPAPAPRRGLIRKNSNVILQKLAGSREQWTGEFNKARTAFPTFCHDWERKLAQREHDNLGTIHWTERNGWQTGTYVGYSKIESCMCDQRPEGAPVGKLTYHEYIYYLAGRTVEEAKRATPKSIGVTSTLELFNWSDHQWQY